MITKFKTKYGIKSNYQLIVIFIVFGITGSTAAFISDPLMEFINVKKYIDQGLKRFTSEVKLKKYPSKKHSY